MSNILHFNTDAEITQIVEATRATFKSGYTKSLKFRRHQLEQLWRMVDENQELFCASLYKDLHKHKNEAILGEIVVSKEEINDALEHLEQWAKDEVVKPSLINRANTTVIRKEPKGNVLIIAPWNYPLYLSVGPLVGAIAAGCTAVLKPSEVAPHTAKVLTDLLPLYLDSKAYKVVNGAAHETTALLKFQFDHIFYTGNGVVGKIIMRAAAEYLTPLTLELGGKSPAIIDSDCNMKIAAKRIVFGKTFNAGQTCVAPDYILITPEAEPKFIKHFKEAVRDMFGENPQTSKDYARIINNRHFHRLSKVLHENKSGEIVVGGQTDEKDLYIAPTLIANVDREDSLMQDEIFGPLLPMIRINDYDDAIEFINSRDHPLALYLFSTNKKLQKKVLDSTQSGGVLVNDCLMHVSEGALPFGGIGPSGMGNYHGKKSFDCFTHERATLIKDMSAIPEAIAAARYAPYTNSNLKMALLAIESVPRFKKGFIAKHLKWIVLAIIFGVGYRRLAAA